MAVSFKPVKTKMAQDHDEIFLKLESKIQEGEALIDTLNNYKNIPGIGKLTKKIQKELQFLCRFKDNPKKLKVEHLQCSNLLHLSAIVQALETCKNPTHILRTFNNSDNKKVIVDIVSEGGFQWIKGKFFY